MLIPPDDAQKVLCPRLLARPDLERAEQACYGKRCMAFHLVTTQQGERAYCGLAGMPPSIAVAVYRSSSALAPARRIALPE